MKLIIDCDAGLDDAMALIMALDYHRKRKVEILAITCVQGNTSVHNAAKNVSRILDTFGEDGSIPVFKGAVTGLVKPYVWTHPPFHGQDGFGDVHFAQDPDMSRIQQENAVNALVRIVDENPGEIDLVLIGPLTNAALAMRMDPDFTQKLKAMYVMGGNYEVLGKTPFSIENPEFNFKADPDAAFVVFEEVACPMHIFSWELCELQMGMPVAWRKDLFNGIDTPIAKLQDLIERKSLATYDFHEYLLCDQLAMAGLLNPNVITKSTAFYSTVELTDAQNRGRTIVDVDGKTGKKPNAIFIDGMSKEILEGMILEAYRGMTF